MFTPTPDALVEISAMLRVLKSDGDKKVLIAKVHEQESTFILTAADCRHLAAALLKDLPDEKPVDPAHHQRLAADGDLGHKKRNK
jgi:hypothetical protein